MNYCHFAALEYYCLLITKNCSKKYIIIATLIVLYVLHVEKFIKFVGAMIIVKKNWVDCWQIVRKLPIPIIKSSMLNDVVAELPK